jgi:RNA polymerase sigma-70 factor (ECF subfamily)
VAFYNGRIEATMSEEPTRSGGQATDPSSWVDQHGDCLFRFALVRLGNSERAEDVVQETFVAALQNRESFKGRAAERTWLLSILRHKLADYFRDRERLRPATDVSPPTGDVLDELFDEKGRWRVQPSPGPDDPAATLERREFWETFRKCLARLPARLAAAFALREVDGMSSEDVRATLGVSASNLWVLLHRARLGLARCLDVSWFDTPSGA